jgi:hypothetical protein
LPDIITVSHGDLFSDMVADIASVGSFWYLLPVFDMMPPFCLLYEAAFAVVCSDFFYSDLGAAVLAVAELKTRLDNLTLISY